MADVQQIVDRLRARLQAGEPGDRASLEALAAAFAQACAEANERLARCSRLIQGGLRSESIHLAETDPDLLGTVAALDFAERADWDALASVPAVRDGRVHVLGDTLFVTPGPRLAEALRRLVPLLWGA